MSKTRLNIPEHIAPYLVAEYCDDFPMTRYFVSKTQVEIIEDVMRAQKVKDKLVKYGIYYLNSTLLYGVPGTGKTTFGRYMANCFDLDFVYINFAKLFDGVFGKTAGVISDIFQYMSKTKAIFMLDEIDAISQKRGTESAATGGEISRITVTIMQELDLMKRRQVDAILIGCTNRIDIMDDALKSRFSIKKELKDLDNSEKLAYIQLVLNDMGVSYNMDNLRMYCARNNSLTQRAIEFDIQRCLIRWISEGEGAVPFMLDHIREQTV